MASLRLESICCTFRDNDSVTTYETNSNYYIYNGLCIFSASISILGALYQLTPKQPTSSLRNTREIESFLRQNYIIIWLAVADLLASAGILIRASVWLSGKTPTSDVSNFNHIFCAVSSAFIQYCYICTYFWTFCYALDIYRLTHGKESCGGLYQVLGWLLPGALCLATLVPFYTPTLTECGREIQYLVPQYLVTFVPMMLVMVGNPVLYFLAQREVQSQLRNTGLYTDQERSIIKGVQKKFFLISLVFYVCWIPNVLDAILLSIDDEPKQFLFALWHFMALINPLQAFLNCLVYRGLGGCLWCTRPEGLHGGRGTRAIIQASHAAFDQSNEISPLLSFRKSGHHSSRSSELPVS